MRFTIDNSLSSLLCIQSIRLGHISTVSLASLVSQHRKHPASCIKANDIDSLGLYIKSFLSISDVKKAEIGK